MRSVKSVLLLTLIVFGCSDSTSPDPLPGDIVGKWSESQTLPGNVWEMDLTLAGATISGSGSWCGEAGPCGVNVISGTSNGIQVHLDITSTPQVPIAGTTTISHFDGTTHVSENSRRIARL